MTIRPALARALLAVAATCTGPAALAQSLCSPSEKVLFSCEIGRKVLSVCGSRDLDDTQGVMQYRFGTPDKLDLAYPEKPTHPSKAFKSNRLYSAVEQALIMELSFKRGDVTYTVYREDIRGKAGAGVTVNIKGKDTDLKCKDTKGSASFVSAIDSLNLPQAE